MDYRKGSLWRKWDLHVHTPYSLVHHYHGSDEEERWENFVVDLEGLPDEYKVIGINDYIFLDGYKRVLQARAEGRLQNIDLFLPVIELRLDKFGGSKSKLNRVNYHLIFSNELSPELIETQFLPVLKKGYRLSPEYKALSKKWQAIPDRATLTDLGNMIIESVPLEKRHQYGPPLMEGFNALCCSLDSIQEGLNNHYFEGKVLTAIGKTEWYDIQWNDHSIAEKKTIINSCDLVFISSATISDYYKARKSLCDAQVNSKLLDCSDAHCGPDSSSKDRIGKCFTWIKADPTFDGLRLAVGEFDERMSIVDTPEILNRIRNNKTKFIDSVSIHKLDDTDLRGEKWFDSDISLNPGLIAIIGNKGSGKSALTDTLGLLGDSPHYKSFSFLHANKFKNVKNNKAVNFEAELRWKSGHSERKNLAAVLESASVETVKYIPQNYIEDVCNEVSEGSDTSFDKELKSVIFSHLSEAQKLGKETLEEVIKAKQQDTLDKLDTLRSELHTINEEILLLENQQSAEYRKLLEAQLSQKNRELESHDQEKPATISKPEDDPDSQERNSIISCKIQSIRSEIATLNSEVDNITKRLQEELKVASVGQELRNKLDDFQTKYQQFVNQIGDDLVILNLSPSEVLEFRLDDRPIIDAVKKSEELSKLLNEQLKPDNPQSKVFELARKQNEVDELVQQLDASNLQYQQYLQSLERWGKKREEIVGHHGRPGSLKHLEGQIERLGSVPLRLENACVRRTEKAREIFQKIAELANEYRTLYKPVADFIDENQVISDQLRLGFKVEIGPVGFEDKFLKNINQGRRGSFCGLEEGKKLLKEILDKSDLTCELGVIQFLDEMVYHISSDVRANEYIEVEVSDQLTKSADVSEFYDYLYSLDYLIPRYLLQWADKDLQQLSPGERGTLLLIFYLLIDKNNIPLIIDQPEGNLDNQTIFETLVACIKLAKKRRQIIIVTHNPNLAVVCDAEQIIWARLDKQDGNKITYTAGSIENPVINKKIVDILEGTMPAFSNRDTKYKIVLGQA